MKKLQASLAASACVAIAFVAYVWNAWFAATAIGVIGFYVWLHAMERRERASAPAETRDS